MTEQQRRTFHAGNWYAVSGVRTTVLLPPSLKPRVIDVWPMIDEGAAFNEVLDVLIAQGLCDLPSFVLIGESNGTTQVLVRGEIGVTLVSAAGETFLDGTSAGTWVEQSVGGLARLVVELEAIGDSSGSPLHAGLVQVGRIEFVAEEAASGPADDVDVDRFPDVAAVAAIDAEVTVGDPVDPVLSVEPVDLAPLDTEDLTGVETAGAITQAALAVPEPVPPVIRNDQEPTEPFPPPQAHTGTDYDGADYHGADHDGADHDGTTRTGTPSGDYERPQPGIPGQQHPPSVISRPVARLLVSNGDVVEVDRLVLVGRAPEGRRFSPEEQPALVTVDSPLQEISSTHLEVRPGSGADHGSAVVTDLGSTNGTVLVQPGLPPESMQPGIAVQLIPGAIIDLGDGVTIQVTNA